MGRLLLVADQKRKVTKSETGNEKIYYAGRELSVTVRLGARKRSQFPATLNAYSRTPHKLFIVNRNYQNLLDYDTQADETPYNTMERRYEILAGYDCYLDFSNTKPPRYTCKL
jgi:hypothetical protein